MLNIIVTIQVKSYSGDVIFTVHGTTNPPQSHPLTGVDSFPPLGGGWNMDRFWITFIYSPHAKALMTPSGSNDYRNKTYRVEPSRGVRVRKIHVIPSGFQFFHAIFYNPAIPAGLASA